MRRVTQVSSVASIEIQRVGTGVQPYELRGLLEPSAEAERLAIGSELVTELAEMRCSATPEAPAKKSGSVGRIRTYDRSINSRLLYH